MRQRQLLPLAGLHHLVAFTHLNAVTPQAAISVNFRTTLLISLEVNIYFKLAACTTDAGAGKLPTNSMMQSTGVGGEKGPH